MDARKNYNTYKREIGKDALKALAFFFIGLPLIVAAVVWLVMF